MAEFEKRKNGDIKINPLTGWQFYPTDRIAVLLGLSYEEDPGREAPFYFVGALHPNQCRELAAVLVKKADEVDRRFLGKPIQ